MAARRTDGMSAGFLAVTRDSLTRAVRPLRRLLAGRADGRRDAAGHADAPRETGGRTDAGHGTASPSAGRRRALSGGLVAATVLTTALAVWLGVQVQQQREADQRREAILAAARQSALNFTSLDYRHYDRDSANVLKGATGDFKEQFAAQTEELTALVAENRSVSEGQVLEAGIVRSDTRSARVLVVADSKVTNTAVPDGEARTYRLQLDLVLAGDRWLTSDVEFVG